MTPFSPLEKGLLSESPHVYRLPVLIYLGVGVLWILASDAVLSIVVTNPNEYQGLQTFKGLIFVVGTTLLLGFLLKRQQEKVVGAQEELLSIFRNYPTVVWMSDQSGKRVWFNTYWSEYTGLSLEESQQWGWLEAVHPNDLVMLKDVTETSLMMEQQYRLRYRLQSKDGHYEWFEEHTIHRTNTERSDVQLIGICIPSRSSTLDPLTADGEGTLDTLARPVLSATTSAFIISDREGRVINQWSEQASAFGTILDALEHVKELGTLMGSTIVQGELDRVTASAKSSTFDFIAQVKGEALHVGCCISPVELEQDRHYVVVFRDRTTALTEDRHYLQYLAAGNLGLDDVKQLVQGPQNKRNEFLISACAPLLSGRAQASIWEDITGNDKWRQLEGRNPHGSDEALIRDLLSHLPMEADPPRCESTQGPGLQAGLILASGSRRLALVLSGLDLTRDVPRGTKELFSNVCALGTMFSSDERP